MALKKLECSVCGHVCELDVPTGKMIYKCPKCKLTVRIAPPKTIETPKPTPKPVKSTEEIPAAVAEEVKKAAEEQLSSKEETKKEPTKKTKAAKKQKKPKSEG